MTEYNMEEEYGGFLDDVIAYIDSGTDENLQHYGVKGMRWGKRKTRQEKPEIKTLGPDLIVRKTKSGDEITMSKDKPGPITRFLARHNKNIRESVANSASLTIRDKEGKKVGQASLEKHGKDTLYINWIGINEDSRGKGYASAVMQSAESFAREAGLKKMTLEVPGNSPDARHIYEKQGFKVVKEPSKLEASTDPVWGGLTSMEYDLGAKHSAADNFLSHYGVKGMKWGVSKTHHREYQEVATKDTANNIAKRQMANVNMVRYMAKGRGIQERRKFDEKWYNSLETGKTYMAQGTTLSRVVRGVDQNALNGYTYVSALKSDTDMYTATIPAFTNGFKAGKKQYHSAYQVSLETKKRLAMPSAKERVDTFIETLQTKDGRQWLSDNGYKKEIDELNAKEVGLKYYDRFNKFAGNKDVTFNNVYFNTIKAKGYDALLDDNDAGIWSKKPTILLNPKGSVKITNVRQLSAVEINDAQRKVMKLRDYKSDRK